MQSLFGLILHRSLLLKMVFDAIFLMFSSSSLFQSFIVEGKFSLKIFDSMGNVVKNILVVNAGTSGPHLVYEVIKVPGEIVVVYFM